MLRRTYSKRRAEQSSLVSQCFAASDSPVKLGPRSASTLSMEDFTGASNADQPPTSAPPDSPARNTRDQCRRRARHDAEHDRPAADGPAVTEGIGTLTQEMSTMALTQTKDPKSYQLRHGRPDVDRNNPRMVLQSRDANIAGDKLPRTTRRGHQALQKLDGFDSLLCKFNELEITKSDDSKPELEADPSPVGVESPSPSIRTPPPKPNPGASSQANAQESVLSTYTKSLLDLCSDPASRTSPTLFQSWANDLSEYFHIRKIAEASYGEVYRLSLRSSGCGIRKEQESVLKLIALKPPPRLLSICKASSGKSKSRESKKTLAMSAVEDVASEVRLLRHLTPVPGFTNFREVRVLKGRLPHQFVAAWKHYDKHVKKSLFPDPQKKSSYGEEQLWAVVEMQDAGTDVESLLEGLEEDERVDVCAVWDVFWSVACSVAKAEEWTGFEHRDLHLGNICIRSMDPGASARSTLNPGTTSLNLDRTIGYTGLETTIIDYTLSRADLSNNEGQEERDIVYFNLAKDPAIFEGDAADDYQYEMYRAMRSAVIQDTPARGKLPSEDDQSTESTSADDWRASHPMTNLIWLHFVLCKLLERMSDGPEARGAHRAVASLRRGLRKRLRRLEKVLALETLASSIGIRKTADLVEWAVELGWLREEDVVGRDESDV